MKTFKYTKKILRMKLENEEALHAQEIVGFILSKLSFYQLQLTNTIQS